MTTTSDDAGRGRHDSDDHGPTIAEIAALTARLRDLSSRGAAVSPDERAAFLANKDELLGRITATAPNPTPDTVLAAVADRRSGHVVAVDAEGGVHVLSPGDPGYNTVGGRFEAESFEAGLRSQLPPARRTAVFLAQAQQAVENALARDGYAGDGLLEALDEEIDNATRALATPPAHEQDPVRAAGEARGRAELAVLLDDDQAPAASARIVTDWRSWVAQQYQADQDWADEQQQRVEAAAIAERGGLGPQVDATTVGYPHQGRAGDTSGTATDWMMPQWMRANALSAQAADAEGTAPPARPDDLAELAARAARLREQIAARTGTDTGVDPARGVAAADHSPDAATVAAYRAHLDGFLGAATLPGRDHTQGRDPVAQARRRVDDLPYADDLPGLAHDDSTAATGEQHDERHQTNEFNRDDGYDLGDDGASR